MSANLVLRFWLLAALALPLAGQAWVPAKGEIDLATSYQNTYTADHLFAHGERVDSGHVYLQGMLSDVTYGVTDRLALKVALPFFAGKYNGPTPHQLPIDGGTYHGTFQDFSAEVRYNIARQPFVITPFITVVVPSHDYQYFAHSAVGRDMREARLGVNLGRRLDPLVRRGFAQVRLSYNFVERVLNVYHDGMTAEVEAGYFLSRRLALITLATGQTTFGGLNYPKGGFSKAFIQSYPELFHHHDQIGRLRLIDLGGGAAYQVTPSFGIFAAGVTTLWGTNAHAINAGITFGVNWTFQTRGEPVKYARNQMVGGADGFVQARCICPKK